MLLLGPLVVTLGLRHVRSAARIVGAHRRPADVRCRTLVACARDPPAIITNLESIAAEYDVLLLDQFGVMHDGKRALPGAIECFDRLAAAGKRLVVLSNTSRRRAFAMKKLPSLGFPAEKLSGFVCSGEEAWQHMAAGWRGKRALWFSWAEDFHAWEPDWLEGLNTHLNIHLSSAADADFIICQGSMVMRTDDDALPTELMHTGVWSAGVEDALRLGAERGIPMICANPDFHVTLPDGTRGHMPGILARRYEELGGHVVYFGKPHRAAFEAALRLLNVPPSRVLHVGDSLLHDVAGASNAGVDSLFVAGGIHADELGIVEGDVSATLESERLQRLFDEYGTRPSYSIAAFTW